MKLGFLAVLLFLVIGSTGVQAQRVECNPNDFRNYDQGQVSEEYRAAYLKIITKDVFEVLKKERGGGGGFIIGGIGLSANATYNEFDLKRNRELEKIGYSEEVKTARNYVRNSLDGEGARAYHDCLKAMVTSKQGRGLFAWLDKVTSNSVVIKIHWRPTVGTPPVTLPPTGIKVTGSSTSLAGFPQSWPADTEHTLILQRIPDQELTFEMNLQGDGADVVLPPKPILHPNRQLIWASWLDGDWSNTSVPPGCDNKLVWWHIKEEGNSFLGQVKCSDPPDVKTRWFIEAGDNESHFIIIKSDDKSIRLTYVKLDEDSFKLYQPLDAGRGFIEGVWHRRR